MVLQSAKSTNFQIKRAKPTNFWNMLAGCHENLGYQNLHLQKAIIINKMRDSKKQAVTNVA